MPTAKKAAKRKQKGIEVGIRPSRESTSDRIYANYVHVLAGPLDVALTFCDVLPPINDVPSGHIIDAPVQAEIVIPKGLLNSLITALTTVQQQIEAIDEDNKTT